MKNQPGQAAFAEALGACRASSPAIVPHVVDGEELFDGPSLKREDPSQPSCIVSICHDAPTDLVRRAVAASRKAQRSWARLPLLERADRVRAALSYVEGRAEEWAVRVALEVGKPYVPAVAEIVEVAEILRFYTEYVRRPGAFEDERGADPSGLVNASVLRPYGVFGVITPFNYPMVQAAGPTIAALLAGNGVVVKTSHHGPWSGHAVYEMCAAMDLPQGLVNIVHGRDEPGRALVASDVDGISFTGSVAVGNSIIRQLQTGPYPRPVIAEMGGKNPVVVTQTADLEAAADGIVFSAFDLSGQKCSALSRVLVDAAVHDRLVGLVEERAARFVVGDPSRADSGAGPLVDPEALGRFERIVKQAQAAGFRVRGGERLAGDGYFVAPAVVSAIPADHPLATTEHFAPFLTISPVDGFAQALEKANDTPMGLTAGIYTGDLEQASAFLDGIEAGCVNVNVPGHATTGWWPGPQTFGGWKASGSTGKQGLGKWYVQQFARQQARKMPPSLEQLLGR